MDAPVLLNCVQINGRLRVRILDNNYITEANCQFPKDLRIVNRFYVVPKKAIILVVSNKKSFYRINKKLIKIVDEDSVENAAGNKCTIGKVYTDDESDECIICLNERKHYVFSPCGHFYVCKECKSALNKRCPICRSDIRQFVPRCMVK
jgi:hypothetical protein